MRQPTVQLCRLSYEAAEFWHTFAYAEHIHPIDSKVFGDRAFALGAHKQARYIPMSSFQQ